jgi:hypothetical protein
MYILSNVFVSFFNVCFVSQQRDLLSKSSEQMVGPGTETTLLVIAAPLGLFTYTADVHPT